jgi:hypothetical protein
MLKRPLVPDTLAVPLVFAAIKLVLHAFAAPNWGYFRDELYYIACSKHLAWVADLTYVATWRGSVYVAFVMGSCLGLQKIVR